MELAARPLRVERLELLDMPDADTALFEMVCGKGGYVRSIARDLGRALGCLGHVLWLRRDWSGPFRAEDGIDLDTLDRLAGTGELDARLLPVQAALAGLPEVRATEAGAARLARGNPGEVLGNAAWGTIAWASRDGVALAVGEVRGGMLHPSRVFR
jgi:tRNA pseudouridine55 synthase